MPLSESDIRPFLASIQFPSSSQPLEDSSVPRLPDSDLNLKKKKKKGLCSQPSSQSSAFPGFLSLPEHIQ